MAADPATTLVSNATLVNFVGGETSPKSRGRFDTAWFLTSCQKLLNFVPEISGPARYRSGFRHAGLTRRGGVARMVPFQVNRDRAFILEFTNLKMRAYKDGRLVTQPRTTLTGITQANPAVATFVSVVGLADDDEIILTDIEGMTELNGRQVVLANGSGSTFELVDPITGLGIDSTGFDAYVSNGTVDRISEIDTPYTEGILDDLNWASKDGVMYLAHLRITPRKLTIDSVDQFTLAVYSRTADPFVVVAGNPIEPITDIFLGTQTKLEFAPGAVIKLGFTYLLTGIVGTVELNFRNVRVSKVESGTGGEVIATIIDPLTDQDIDSTSFTPYISDGFARPLPDNPITVTFYEGRLFFLGTDQRPATLFGSRSPDSAGAPRYDDFTGGTDADFAVFFTLASTGGQTNDIAWGIGTSKFLFVGTFSGPFRVSGGGLELPITPTSITARQFDAFGCEATSAAGTSTIFYIQRGGRTLRNARFSDTIDEFDSRDTLLNAEHIGEISRLRRVVLQAGRPDVVWVVRDDGFMAGLTFESDENVTGWHRHQRGGTDAKVLDVQILQRTDRNDQLWIVAEHKIGNTVFRALEIQADDPFFPDREDFFSEQTAEDADLEIFRNVLYRRQEEYVHLDGAATFNGTDRGVAAAATLTPGALTGIGITFTASKAVFKAGDVGLQLWKKPDRETGIGSGRATITTFNSPTEVVCDIFVDFDAVTAIPAGDWYIAVKIIQGVWHQEGGRVAVIGDGGVVSDGLTDEYDTIIVTDGTVTLKDFVGVAHIGSPYEGFLQTQNLEMGGRSGPAQAKPRNIVEMFIRFLNTLGTQYGTSIYKTEKINHRDNSHKTSRPIPVFSGIRKLPHHDDWKEGDEKVVVIAQRLPLPCIVQFIDMRFDTGDEGR